MYWTTKYCVDFALPLFYRATWYCLDLSAMELPYFLQCAFRTICWHSASPVDDNCQEDIKFWILTEKKNIHNQNPLVHPESCLKRHSAYWWINFFFALWVYYSGKVNLKNKINAIFIFLETLWMKSHTSGGWKLSSILTLHPNNFSGSSVFAL